MMVNHNVVLGGFDVRLKKRHSLQTQRNLAVV
jgi:hypothetical protein